MLHREEAGDGRQPPPWHRVLFVGAAMAAAQMVRDVARARGFVKNLLVFLAVVAFFLVFGPGPDDDRGPPPRRELHASSTYNRSGHLSL